MNRRYELFLYPFFDHTGIARHLERMALKGWELEKTGALWCYRRVPRQAVHYAVTYFPSSTPLDPAPSEQELLFRDFCESAGWEFVAQAGNMQIFRNLRPDPVPLDTEPEIEVETIHAAMMGSHLKSQGIIAALFALQLFSLIARLMVDPLSILKYGGNLFSALASLLLLADIALETVSYFSWRKRALAEAAEGRFLPTPGRRWPKALYLLLIGGMFLYYLAMLEGKYLTVGLGTVAIIFSIVGVMQLIQKKLKQRGLSGRKNFLVTSILGGCLGLVCTIVLMGFILLSAMENRYDGAEAYSVGPVTHYAYHDELPLYIEDITGAKGSEYSNRLYESGSFLLRETQVNIHRRFDAPRNDSLPTSFEYTVRTSPFAFMINLAVEDRIDFYANRTYFDSRYEPVLPLAGAEEAWQLYDEDGARNQYLLRFDGCVMELSFDFVPTEEQLITAVSKLLHQ
ncbi:MAG: DUF2812 domain-containing protein [Oscillibacter sp.]|nr:DUF2812 domain-containing protein [Oscillibacter sp.]